MMTDQWMLRGVEFNNCNCDWGCPCQFHAPSTHGFCEAFAAGHIEEGHFNDIRLDGLNWAMVLHWPGEIAAGSGKQQVIIDSRATDAQREALRKILHGESTAPGATHFFVFNSTMSEVLAPLSAPIDLTIDVEARKAEVNIPDVAESKGNPILNTHTGTPHHARINLPNGFEYTVAEVGTGTSSTKGGIALQLTESHAHFNTLHMNQDGVIRA